MRIYKRKQESKKTRKKKKRTQPRKRSRKKENKEEKRTRPRKRSRKQENDKEKKKILSFFLDHFLGRVLVFFLVFFS